MADARALLRAERAARKITHPHASYTTDGKLLCNLCETPVKSEAHWQSHLHSTQHNLRSQRRRDAAATRGASDGGGKKRKAESPEDEHLGEGRKKARADDDAGLTTRSKRVEDSAGNNTAEGEASHPAPPNGSSKPHPTSQPAQPPDSNINTDDILAFERELDDLEAEAMREEEQARSTAATISAAPLTAEEVAAQAREEQSKQRGRRDEELEGEKEDAARTLEEEMDEMEGLESRLRVLRERRERLRRTSEGEDFVGVDNGESVDGGGGEGGSKEVNGGLEAEEGGSEEDDDDDDDPDEWKFGGS